MKSNNRLVFGRTDYIEGHNHRMEKFIYLPVYGITLHLNENDDGDVSGTIESDLHESENGCEDYNIGIDVLESFILASACAGIDVGATSFLQAIEETVEAIGNKYDYD